MKTIKIILIGMLCTFLVSCNKKNEDGNEKVGTVKLLESVVCSNCGDYGEVIKFEYDDQNRFSRVINMNNRIWRLISITYNSADEIILYYQAGNYDNFQSINKISFKKDNNIVKTNFYNRDGNIVYGDYYLELNTQGLPVKAELYHNRFEYEYQNGNLTQKKHFENGLYWVSTTFIYDDKKSPLINCKTPKWLLDFCIDYGYFSDFLELGTGSRNNVLFYTGSITQSHTYSYDDAGYPLTSMVSGRWSSSLNSYTFTYITK